MLVQQNGDLEACRSALAVPFQQEFHGVARIDDAVREQNVLPRISISISFFMATVRDETVALP